MATIGAAWGDGVWDVTAWGVDVWDAAVAVVPESTGGGASMTLRQMRRLEREQLLAMIREDDDLIVALLAQLMTGRRQ